MEEFVKSVVRDNMDYMESAYRDVMVDKVASSWDKMEELEAENSLEFNWTDKGHLEISLSFNAIFNRASVTVYWWEKPTSWAIICLLYDGEWDMHVQCQGEESIVERICRELVKEEN